MDDAHARDVREVCRRPFPRPRLHRPHSPAAFKPRGFVLRSTPIDAVVAPLRAHPRAVALAPDASPVSPLANPLTIDPFSRTPDPLIPSPPPDQVCAFFDVDPAVGLSDRAVALARRKYGPNEIPAEPGTPFWKLVLKQFDDLLVKILIAAAIVSLVIGLLDGEGLGALVEPGVIVLILVANAAVGVATETNAERAIEELKAYQADVATVMRDGRLRVIPASELVPGDVVDVAVGCKVPADAGLLDAGDGALFLRVDQSILTGRAGRGEVRGRRHGRERGGAG